MKKLIYTLAAFSIIQSPCSISEASAQSFQWATAAGSKNINTKADMPVDLATDANGNSYLLSHIHAKEIYVGSTAISDGLGLSTSLMTLVSSLDRNGKYRWSKVIGAANTDAKEIKVLNDRVYIFGGVVTTATYSGYYDIDFTSPNFYSNISLACYDTSGVFKWAARPDTITEIDNTFYRPISFDVDDAGNSYMLVTMPAGSKIMGSSMTIPSTAPYKGYGFYVLKYGPSGALVSVTMLKDFCYTKGTQGGVDRFRFTLNKKTNQYYVYGVAAPQMFTDTLYIDGAMMVNALFLATFDNDGTYKWDKRDDQSSAGNIGLRKVVFDASGNLILGGSAYNNLTFNTHKFNNPLSTLTAPGIPFIMKMNTVGNLIWCKEGGINSAGSFNTTYNIAANSRFIAIGGASGKSVYFGETKDSIFVNTSGQDGWFAIVDINSGKTFKMGAARGDGFYDAIRALSFNGDDLYFGGNFENTKMIFDSSAVSVGPAKSGTDLFVAKMSTSGLVSVEEKSANLVNIKIYPNPANDVLYIDQLQDETEIRLLALNGQQVYSGISTGSLHQINVASLTSGIYVLQLRDKAGELYSAKLLKQ